MAIGLVNIGIGGKGILRLSDVRGFGDGVERYSTFQDMLFILVPQH